MTDAAEGRLTPLPPAGWDPSLGRVKESLGTPLNVHNVMARHPVLLDAWLDFRNHIVKTSALTARERELLILRTAHNTSAAYEWKHHVVRGRAAGLTDAEIARVREGPDAAGWSEEEALLLRAADDIHGRTEIARPAWAAMCARFDDRQLLDVIFTVGTYLIMSTVLKTARVPMEEHP